MAACSSGEEVYSFAISLYEFLEEKRIKPFIQIFGTDLSEAMINKARAGIYSEDISAQVSEERLRRFFTKTEKGYKISKPIRDLCIFAKHDITRDPPLSNMDIVSCRNLLIYLDTFLQNKALSMLHYALKPKGFLVLGASESVTTVPNFFIAIEKKQKIYLKNMISRKTLLSIGVPGVTLNTTKAPRKASIIATSKKHRITKQALPKSTKPDQTVANYGQKDIEKLRKDFAQTVARLNAISEEKDTFNEELKAANEEIQSSNEELQSMNEELETSKEEIQSTNEELLTLNDELQNKNIELTHVNNDLSNVFTSTNIPIIIVGNDLHIKSFTPMARKVMNLIPTDVDRPINDIKLNVDIANLEALILGVIEDMTLKELEVHDKEERWYSVRIRPYRTLDNKIDGAVITMVDIDVIKRSQQETQNTLNYTQAIIETMREALLLLDVNLRVLSANKAFYDTFRTQASDVENKLFYELGENQWNIPQLRKLLQPTASKKISFNNFEVSSDFPIIGQRTMLLNGRSIMMSGKNQNTILLVIEDITVRKKAEEVLKRDGKSLERIIKKKSQELLDLETKMERAKYLAGVGTLAATIAHELRNTLAAINIAAYNIRRKTNNPQIEGSLSNIDKMVLEGEQIIQNVLSYSKTKVSHFEVVNLNHILESCVAGAKNRAAEQGIALLSNIELTNQVSIEADPTQIKEVLTNIFNNALDAVTGNASVISIATSIEDAKVSILIKDNGEGVPKKNLKKILDPFFTTKAKGTGLGLSICKQIVTLHNGALTIKSNPGEGTTVQVILPIH